MAKKRYFFKHLIFVFYIVAGIILLIHHEPWRDEANTWLIAKNLNIFQLFDEIRVDGNPCFYYLFLFPFAKSGLPYIFNNIISFSISVVTSYLLIYKTKFNNILLILIICSSLFIYYGGIFGRSYCMVNLLFVLIMIFFEGRYNHIVLFSFLVVFLLNTHIMMFGFCFAIFCVQCFDYLKKNCYDIASKKTQLIGILIECVGMLFLAWQLVGCIHMNEDVFLVQRSFAAIIISFFITVVLLIYVIRRKDKVFFISVFSFIFQFFGWLFVSHSSMYIRNLCFLNVIFLYSSGFKFKYLDFKLIIISLFFFLLFIRDFSIYYQDNFYNFSDSKDVSKYVKKNVSSDDTILCVPNYLCISVLAYISDYRFVDMYEERLVYMNYSKFHNDADLDINEYLVDKKYKYIIIGDNYKKIENDKYKLVYVSFSSHNLFLDEKYKIYKRR